MSKKIIIADDHEVIYQGVRILISNKMPDAEIEWVVDLVKLQAAIDTNTYDLIILDINLPSGNTRAFVDNHFAQNNKTPILIFSAYEEQVFAAVFIKAGAQGYVQKGENSDTVFEAISTVLSGKKYISQGVGDILIKLNSKSTVNESEHIHISHTLTRREMEVAHLIVEGCDTKQISTRLGVSPSSVGTFKKRIFDKLRVDNVVDLARLFQQGNDGREVEI